MKKKQSLLIVALAALLLIVSFVIYNQSSKDGTRLNFDGTTTIEGTITTVFTDCSSHRTLNADGIVDNSGTVTCDGGSYITIDDSNTISTSSGYVPIEDAYDKHNESWNPGDKAVVTAKKTDNGYTLDCDNCKVEIK